MGILEGLRGLKMAILGVKVNWKKHKKKKSLIRDFEFCTDWKRSLDSKGGFRTSVTDSSPSQDSNHPRDHFQSRYVTLGFKQRKFLKRKRSRMSALFNDLWPVRYNKRLQEQSTVRKKTRLWEVAKMDITVYLATQNHQVTHSPIVSCFEEVKVYLCKIKFTRRLLFWVPSSGLNLHLKFAL